MPSFGLRYSLGAREAANPSVDLGVEVGWDGGVAVGVRC